MNDDGMQIVYLVLVLLLPVSALAARRLPLGQTIRMALAWVAIFATLVVLVTLWQSATATGARIGGLFQ